MLSEQASHFAGPLRASRSMSIKEHVRIREWSGLMAENKMMAQEAVMPFFQILCPYRI